MIALAEPQPQPTTTTIRASTSAKTPSQPTPTTFPKITQAEQRQRDTDANAIFQAELDAERLKLVEAIKAGDKARQASVQANIDALAREIERANR